MIIKNISDATLGENFEDDVDTIQKRSFREDVTPDKKTSHLAVEFGKVLVAYFDEELNSIVKNKIPVDTL